MKTELLLRLANIASNQRVVSLQLVKELYKESGKEKTVRYWAVTLKGRIELSKDEYVELSEELFREELE